MPFSQDPLGQIGSALPPATMIVHPDKIIQLKHRLEDRLEKLQALVVAEGERLATVPSPGEDPCSKGAVHTFGRNGSTALEALNGFIAELANVVDALDASAQLYGLAEDSNSALFRREIG